MKKLLVILSFLALTTAINAQDYYSSFGVAINTGLFSIDYTDESGYIQQEQAILPLPGAMYRGVYAFNDMFSAGFNPFLGLYFNSQEGGYLGFELPVIAQINFGDISERNFYVGGGFAYSFFAATDYYAGAVLGPQIELGGEFEAKGNNVGVRLAYTLGMNKFNVDSNIIVQDESKSVIQLGVYYSLQ